MAAGLLYSPVETPLHRVNPLTKLAGLLWFASLAVVLPSSLAWAAGAAVLGAAFAFGLGSAVGPRFLVAALPFLIAVFVVQSLFVAHPDARPFVGPLSISREGLLHAASVGGRVAAIIAASVLFAASTHPAALLRAFDGAGWRPALSYLIASPLLMIDTFGNRAAAIRDAQETRGMRLRGSWSARAFGLPALVFPLITTALIEVDERAHVLVARGFRVHSRRATLDGVPDRPAERFWRFGFLALALIQILLLPWL